MVPLLSLYRIKLRLLPHLKLQGSNFIFVFSLIWFFDRLIISMRKFMLERNDIYLIKTRQDSIRSENKSDEWLHFYCLFWLKF